MKKMLILATIFLILVLALPGSVSAATTEIQVTRYANDGIYVLNQTTVTYTWMEANLPVYGDGVTHYYHQGPVFVDDEDPDEEMLLRWNIAEDTNVLTKDMGAVKGTNAKDLCDLVGGMKAGEEAKFISSDNWNRYLAYENIYGYSDREGPVVLTWWRSGQGNVSDGYYDGMRMVWFADNSTNPWGVHAFGNWDWHEAADEQYWYYYYGGPTELYPTTTGLSGKYINRIQIFSTDPVPLPPGADFSANVSSGVMPVTVQFTDLSTYAPTSWEWDFGDGNASTLQNPSHTFTAAGTYTVNLTATNAFGNGTETKAGFITVKALEADFSAAADAVANGGFETGSLTGWTGTGVSVAAGAAYVGSYGASLYSLEGSDSYIEQQVNFTDAGSLTFAYAIPSLNKGKLFVYLNGSPVRTYESTTGWATDTISGYSGIQTVRFLAWTNTKNNNMIAAYIDDATAPYDADDGAGGAAPLTVHFTDASTDTPTMWAWTFGDGGTSNEQNPTHLYTAEGVYNVTLTATNAGGSDTETKVGFVTVS
ncbi:hypothetical protein AZH53_09615 [Methanomicrobiaceae archaeon CYW5]|uniref:PKD domain-containing protein n=1 Tax=Methanovulcanius yangii TaxID=1789227 RepID=UPI0029C9F042|nr:PKD domain-containing protein [Methanovulcanius yangii]MBT8508661.1 hypothetical protein [Methanovulcanius yangii]